MFPQFKIAVAIPPNNDVDVFANDVGFIAIADEGRLIGFNVTAGGGMGVTHSNKKTYPRTGDVLGFVTPENGHKAAEAILLVQRDNGNRAEYVFLCFKSNASLTWFAVARFANGLIRDRNLLTV